MVRALRQFVTVIPSAQINVDELREHWRRLHALKDGEWIGAVSIYQMPPWSAICEQLDWRLYRLNGGHFSAKRHGRCGVYRLIALEDAGDISKPATLRRLCGEDASGTLYIGEAGDLSLRLNQARRSARPRRSEGSHSAIGMLKQLKHLDYFRGQLGVALMFTGRHTRAIERDLLHAYINSFGDTPPLNYRL